MQQALFEEIRKHITQNRYRQIFRKCVQMLCCIVVFCTTYALILPAITMEQTAFCGLEEHTHSEECFRTLPKTQLICTEELLQVHTHSDSCYDADANIVCGQADYVAHTHNESCWQDEQLVCSLPERVAHVHGDACYVLPETEPPVLHVHGEQCYTRQQGELVCEVEEYEGHAHSDACYAIGETLECELTENHVHGKGCYEYPLNCTLSTEPHNHEDSCYGTGGLLCAVPENHVHGEGCTVSNISCESEEEGHEHGEGCYTTEVVCDIPEGHRHSASCYESIVICGKTEGEHHEHGGECYAAEPECVCTMPENHVHEDSCYALDLICTVPVDPGHHHGDDCYQWEDVLSCGLEDGQPEPTEPPEPVLNCTEPVAQTHVHGEACFVTVESEPAPSCGNLGEDHEHTDSCYGCGLKEHTHTLACYSDREADVESEAVWKSTFAHVALTGDPATDVVAIAQTQIGYTESTRNYEVWEDNSIHGYTRYGAWYGAPHGDWCGMFASFCLNYAEVKGMPHNYGVRPWIEELTKLGLYYTAKETKAQKGNLIFFDWDADGLSDHVGIVAEVQEPQAHTGASVKTIEGNSGNAVRYQYYDPNGPVILGYGLLPGQERIPVTTVEPDEISDNLLRLLICGMYSHSHSDDCYLTDGTNICGLEEHVHTLDCVDSSLPVGFADGGIIMRMMYAARSNSDDSVVYHKDDISPLLTGVEIYNANNELVYESKYGTGLKQVTVGENCRILFTFTENEHNQFSPGNNDILIYQMPANLSAAVVGTGVIRNRNNTIVATYQIVDNALRITPVLVNGKNFFGDFNNVSLGIEFYAEVEQTQNSTSTQIDFQGNFTVTVNMNEDTKIDAQKYEMEYNRETQTITYKSIVTAYGGDIPITYISDWWWPDKASLVSNSIQLKDKNGNPLDLNAWTFELTGGSGFKLTPKNSVILSHKEFITLTYDVKVDNDLQENFDLSNSFFAISQQGDKELQDTDTVVTRIIVTNIEKQGLHETETVDGVEMDVLKWTVTIDNPNMDIITMTDTLGQNQMFCEHKPITIKAMKADGTYQGFIVNWNEIEKAEGVVNRTEFTYPLPTCTVDGTTTGYQSYELVYYSHFQSDTTNNGLKVYDNTVTTTTPSTGKHTVGTGSVGVVGIPPGINKTAVADQEWITFTINCTMPAGLYNQSNVLIYDSMGAWYNETGYYFQQNPDSMTVTVTPEGGTAYELAPYTNQQSPDNTYLLVNDDQDFTMYFNTAQPSAATSVWKCQQNSTLTITYRVSRNAPLLDGWSGNPTGKTLNDYLEEFQQGITNKAQLDYAPGNSIEDEVYIVPPDKPQPPLNKTATVATQDGKELDGVYNYSVKFKPFEQDSTVFDTIDGVWQNDITSFALTDAFDSRMEYVPGSFCVKLWSYNNYHNAAEVFKYPEGKDIVPNQTGNLTRMTVNANDLIGTYSDYYIGRKLFDCLRELLGDANPTYEFCYQLRVKETEKSAITESSISLDNAASVEWEKNNGDSKSLGPVHQQVTYINGGLRKDMEVVKDNEGNLMNEVDFTILVNQYMKDLVDGSDTYVLYDTMSSNLIPQLDTLTVEALIDGKIQQLSLAQCQFSYDSDNNKMTFVLPNHVKIWLKYRCKINGNSGSEAQISNVVNLSGKTTLQDIVNSTFKIQEHQGTAQAGNESFTLIKQDGHTLKGLAGVQFKLYGDTVPSDHSGEADIVLEHEEHEHAMYLYNTFTTDVNGMVYIQDTQLTKGHLYALEEVDPPDGYVALADRYWFYMIEPNPRYPLELDCIKANGIVSIKNYPIGYELPSTGGTGYEVYTVGGTLLMLAALILLYNQKKCRKEDFISS